MNRSILQCLAVAGSLLVAGCKADLTQPAERIQRLTSSWQQQLDTLSTNGIEQQEVLASVTAIDDPQPPLAQALLSLRFSTDNDRVGLTVVAAALSRNRDLVAKSMKRGNLSQVTRTIDFVETEMTALLGAVTANAQLRRTEIGELKALIERTPPVQVTSDETSSEPAAG